MWSNSQLDDAEWEEDEQNCPGDSEQEEPYLDPDELLKTSEQYRLNHEEHAEHDHRHLLQAASNMLEDINKSETSSSSPSGQDEASITVSLPLKELVTTEQRVRLLKVKDRTLRSGLNKSEESSEYSDETPRKKQMSKKSRPSVPRMTKDQKLLILSVQKVHLYSIALLIQHWSNACDSNLLQSRLLSLLPVDLLNQFLPSNGYVQLNVRFPELNHQPLFNLSAINQLMTWFRSLITFNGDSSSLLSVKCGNGNWIRYHQCVYKQLCACILKRRAGGMNSVLLFVSLCRSIGLMCRFVLGVEFIHYSFTGRVRRSVDDIVRLHISRDTAVCDCKLPSSSANPRISNFTTPFDHKIEHNPLSTPIPSKELNKKSTPSASQSRKPSSTFESNSRKKSHPLAIENDIEVIEIDSDTSIDEGCKVCSARNFTKKNPMLLCDGCNSQYHVYCSGLDSVPKGDWFCSVCSTNKPKKSSTSQKKNFVATRSENITVNKESEVPNVAEESVIVRKKITKNKVKQNRSQSNNSPIGSSDTKSFFIPPSWCEVYCVSEQRWIHVDVINGKADSPLFYERELKHLFAFVLSAHPSTKSPIPSQSYSSEVFKPHIVKDVTQRYSAIWSSTCRIRKVDEGWWSRSLHNISPTLSSTDKILNDEEEMQLTQATDTEPVPTTLASVKNHPKYVADIHVLKFQCIYPLDSSQVVGKLESKGKTIFIYPRRFLRVLHTKDRWLREHCRRVRDDEIDHPAKIVKQHVMHSAHRRAAKLKRYGEEYAHLVDEEENEQSYSKLYGDWQTDVWRPPPCVDGKVPKNDRGNIDFFVPELQLPAGGVHIPYPRTVSIAKAMRIDYAEAMTGFDVRRGGMVPVFSGIIVCKEFEAEVLERYWKHEKELEEKERAKVLQKAEFNWRRLIKALIIRCRVMKELKEKDAVDMSDKLTSESVDSNNIQSGSTPGSIIPQVLNNLHHTHNFNIKSFDEATAQWTQVCLCGMRQQFEEM